MKPSLFTMRPFGSVLQKMEAEIVAQNIMIILSRTGDVFRELSWEEYVDERLKDKSIFTNAEKEYFNKVIYLATSDKDKIINFSQEWKDAYIKQLESLI